MIKSVRLKFRELYFVEDRRDIRKVLRQLDKRGCKWRCGEGLGCSEMRHRLRIMLNNCQGSSYNVYIMVDKRWPTNRGVVSCGTDLIEDWI